MRILPPEWFSGPPPHVTTARQSTAGPSAPHAQQQKVQSSQTIDSEAANKLVFQRTLTASWVAPGVFVTTMIAVISILALALRKQSLWIYSAALLMFGLYQSPLALGDLFPASTLGGDGGYYLFSGLECFAVLFLWFGLSYLELLSNYRAKVAVLTCFVCMGPLQMFKTHFPDFIDVLIFSWSPFFILIAILAIIKSRTGFRPAPYLVVGTLGIATCWCIGGSALMLWGDPGQSRLPFWSTIPWFTVGLIWLTAFIFVSISDGVVAANRKTLQVTLRYAEAARRFVPDDFLRALGHTDIADVQLGDRVERDMAVLFSDIRSFTSLSEMMSADETMTFVNEYLAYAGPTIREHGGFIDKYIGDAIMALFEDPDGALKAAIGLQESLHRFNEMRLSRGEAPISIGVGVHAGTLMLGTVGEERRIDTTVIADAVNVASRVEGLTKAYHVGIVVTDDLVKRLKEPPESLRLLGETQVTGLERAILVYACEPQGDTTLATAP